MSYITLYRHRDKPKKLKNINEVRLYRDYSIKSGRKRYQLNGKVESYIWEAIKEYFFNLGSFKNWTCWYTYDYDEVMNILNNLKEGSKRMKIFDDGEAIYIIHNCNDIVLSIPYYIKSERGIEEPYSNNKEEAISLAKAIIEEFY